MVRRRGRWRAALETGLAPISANAGLEADLKELADVAEGPEP